MITFFVMLAVTAGISGFVGYRLVHDRLVYNDAIARMMGQVLASVVSNLRSEMTEGIKRNQKQEEFNIKWSQVFNGMVKDSKNRKDIYRIDEIFLLNRKGEMLAHSDVTKLSKFHADNTDRKDMVRVGSRSPDSPVKIEVQSIFSGEHFFHPDFYEFVKIYFPDLIAETYLVSYAVFPVDSKIANATLHILLKNTSFLDHYSQIEKIAIRTAAAAFAFSVFISLFVMLIVMITAGRKASGQKSEFKKQLQGRIQPEIPAGMEIFESESHAKSGVAGAQMQDTSRRGSVILDAIPLDDIKKGTK